MAAWSGSGGSWSRSPGPIHAMSVGARVVIETGSGRPIPCEVVGFTGSNALLMPFAPLEGVRRGCRALVSTVAGAVRPSAGWLGRVVNAMGEPIDGKGPLPGGPSPYPFRVLAAAGACAPPRRCAARSRRAGAQYLPDRVPRPAHGHFFGLRRRQVGPPVDAGTQCRGRRLGHRPRRRAGARGAGIPPGRPGRGGSRPLGRRRLDLRRAGADAPTGRLSHPRHRRIFPRRGTRTCSC